MFRWITTKLRNKAIVVLIALGIVPLIMVGIAVNSVMTTVLNKKINQIVEQTMDNISLLVSKDLQSFIDVAFNIAQNKNVQEILAQQITSQDEQKEVFYSLKREIFSKPLIEYSIYPYQYMVITSNWYVFTSFSYFDPENSEMFRNILNKASWYEYLSTSPVSKVIIVSEHNYYSPRLEDQLFVCTNIFNNFDPVGLIIIEYDKYYMSRLLERMRIGKKGSIYIINNNNNCVVQADGNFIPFNKLPEDLITDILDGDNNFSSKYILEKENEFFITYRDLYMKNVDGNWKVILITSKEDIKREVNFINYIILGIALLSTGVVAVLVFLIDKTIVKPILELNEFAKQVQDGNLEVRSGYTRNDEIGMLAKIFNQMVSRLKQYIEEVKKKERIKRKLEISVLQSQINPHFVKNTLNTIRWLAEMTGAVSISKAILSIIRLIDYNYRMSEHSVSIKEEISYLEEYLYLQKLRYQNKFTSKIEVSNEILDGSILKLILQPIVENSIIHGFEKKKGLGILSVKGEKIDNKVVFTISDNGIGMSRERLKKIIEESNFLVLESKFDNSSDREITDYDDEVHYAGKNSLEEQRIKRNKDRIGIANVVQRIKLNYGDEYGLTISTKKNIGTTVTITIPYIKHTQSKENINKIFS